MSACNHGREPARPGPAHLPARIVLFLAALGPLAPLAPAAAQVPDTLRRDTVYELEPVGVRAVRPSTTAGGVSAVVLRLDSIRMRPAPILEDVLRNVPLVQVRANSRGEAQLALRGAEERQIAILLDGVPLTLGWDHRTDLSIVPLTAARSITLIRGLATVLHGPNVLGGAVEIGLGSAGGAPPSPLGLAAGVDHHGGYSAAAHTGLVTRPGDGSLTIRAGAGHRDRPGLSAPDGAPSVHPSLAAGDRRVNSHARSSDGFISARYARAGAWVSATATGYTGERGVPPELSEPEPRLWRYPEISRTIGILAGGTGPVSTPAGSGELTFSLGADGGRTLIHDYAVPSDPAAASGPGPFFETLDETEASEDLVLTARGVAHHDLGDAARLRLAVTYADVSHNEVITTGIADGSPTPVPGSYRQRLWSAGVETDVPFTVGMGGIRGGRVSAGLVWDGADTPETGGAGPGTTTTDWGGRLGVSGTSGGGGLLLHAALSRRGRFPALREMYSTALGRFAPNPALRPEILTAAEAGFTGRRGGFDVQLVAFHQRLADAIVRGPAPEGSGARFQRINRDEVRSTGIELLAGYALGRVLLESEATLQDVRAIVREGSATGPVRAEYEPELIAGIGASLPLALGIEGGAEIGYVGRQYCATPVSATERYAELEPSTRLDAQLARSFRLGTGAGIFSSAGVELAVDNVVNSLLYDQCGLPQPGRTLRLQVRVR